MKTIRLILMFVLTISLFSCEEEDEKSQFTNKLTFGTSINYSNFTLNGEGTSFSTNPGNVAYRLESEEDFDSNAVKFVIKKDGFTYSTEVFASNPVPVGHIFMTTLNYAQPGTYSVEAYIEKAGGDKFVAGGSFHMN